jgi:hypothetical protein
MTPLVLGLVMGGINLGRGIEITQIVRDAGHMYVRNVDFSKTENKNIICRLATTTAMTPTGGNAVVILSRIQKIYQADCDAANLSSGACTNLGHFVFVHRLYVGNQSLRNSNYGTPNPTLVAADGSITPTNYLKNSSLQADSFASVMDLPQGQVAYVSEGLINFNDITFSGGANGVYARSIF